MSGIFSIITSQKNNNGSGKTMPKDVLHKQRRECKHITIFNRLIQHSVTSAGDSDFNAICVCRHEILTISRGFQVLTAAGVKMSVLRDVVSYSLVDIDGRFRGAYCLHHDDDHQITRRNIPEAIMLQLYVS
jgi:hypothetical protein